MKMKTLILLGFCVVLNANNIKIYNNNIKINKIFHNKINIIKNKKYYQLIGINYNKTKIKNCNIYNNILHCDINNSVILIKNNNNIFPIKIIKKNKLLIIHLKKQLKNKRKIKHNKINLKPLKNKILKKILKGF